MLQQLVSVSLLHWHRPWQRVNMGVSVTLLYSGVIFLELF